MSNAGASKAKRNAVMALAALCIYGAVQLLALSGTLLSYHLQVLSLACINIMLVVSLNLITGFTGQFSLGHAGFMAIGAYLSAALTVFYQLPFLAALVLSGVAAALVGIIIGLPALRLKGDYLAIATLGFGEIIRVVILNIPAVGGPRGFTGIPRYTSFGLTYLIMIITIVVIRNFIDSSHGRACVSIREDETAAASLGINTTYYKVTAFAIGAGFAGVAGGLFSHYLQYISPAPGQIGFLRSIDILIMVVLGGLGNITGSVFSAIVLTLLPEFLRGFAEYRMVIYSVLLILMMLFRPEGIMGKNELSLEALESLVGRMKNRKGMRSDGTS
ncbi:MAG: branched-chain amino acid ABC transporter permease [Bacillota bacterium]|jgi:branched-chain amino acid transport system permease protein|nr:branched-chain amino acid ABC transporter permease [Bacillota bacterium]HHT90718.1 branched-chain amino acid ABC transporter permease [Bacillota bacterium]